MKRVIYITLGLFIAAALLVDRGWAQTLFSETFEACGTGNIGTGGLCNWKQINVSGSWSNWKLYSSCQIITGTRTLGMRDDNWAVDCDYDWDNANNKIAYYYTSKVNATGYNSLKLNFKWRCGGEATYDYGKVVYSFDGTTWTDVTATQYQGQTATQTVTNLAMPGALDNQQFYIGFRWINDVSAGSAPGFTVDDISITATAACASTITLGANAPAAANQCASTLKVPIQSFSLAVTVCDGNLTNVGFTTTGSYAAGDISKYQLWYRATTNNISGATQLGVDLASAGGAGARSFAAFASPTLTTGTTYYFWITVDVAAGATNNSTIGCNATTTGDLTSTSTKAGSTAAGGTQTLKASPTASNAGSAQSNCNSGNFTLAGNSPTVGTGLWTCTAGCAGVSITTPAANNSGVTGVVAGTPATLTWTISNSPCAASASNVILTNNAIPTTQATINAYTNNTTGTTLTVNWTRGNGATGVIVVARLTATANINPSNGTTYAANAAFGSGATTGAGNFVVYNGTGTTVNVTALTANTSYTFTVYEFTSACYMTPGSSSAVTTPVVYCTSNGNMTYSTGLTNVTFNTINNSTAKPAAYNDYTAQITNVNIGSPYTLSARVNTDGAYTIYAKAWIDWNANGVFDIATEEYDLGTANNVANGATSIAPSITIPSVAAGNKRMRVSAKYNAYATSCETGYDGEVEDYTVNVVACSAPTNQANSITFTPGCTQITANWTNGNGSKRVVKINTINSFTSPADGTDPAANTVWGGSEQVVYNNTGSSVTVTNLTVGTTYWFRVWEYNCTGASTKYITTTNGTNPLSQVTNSLPSAAGSITTGTTPVCQGQNGVAYAAGVITGATSYGWNYSGAGFSIATGSGTNSITANFSGAATSGNLTIYGINVCGNGTASPNYAITVNTLPSAAGSITTGTTPVCQGQNGVAYAAAAVGGATSYGWNYTGAGFSIASGSGTNSITANFSGAATSGNLTIYGINACGNGTASPNYAIAVNGIPGTAGISSPSDGATDQCSVNPITSLNWTAASGSPTGYKLFFGTDNPPTNIVNGTNLGAVLSYSPASLTTNTLYYWKIVPTNACGDATGAIVWSFTTGTPCYCTPTYSLGCSNTVDYINRVRIGTLDNTPAGTSVGTANCAARYVYYSGVAAPNLAKGDLYNLLITVGSDPSNYTAAWFDWNQDGDFADAGEYFNGGNPGGNGTATIAVTIPAGATTGLTRMRIRGGEDSDINLQSHACGASPSGYGEAEDYKINIIAACTPPSTQATAFTSSSLANTTMTVGWTRGNGNNVMVIARAGSAPTDPANGTSYTANAAYGSGTAVGGGFCVYNGTGTSVNLTALTANTVYYFAIYEYNTAGTCYNLTELTGSTQTANDGGNVNHPGDLATATYYQCSGNYYDPGGPGAGNYADNITVSTITFYPSTSGGKVSLAFSVFDTEDNYDGLMIYDGPNTGSPLISSGLGAGTNATTCPAGSWRGTGTPGTVTSTHATGSLTLVFRSDGSVNSTGWAAAISCISSCTPPGTQATSFSTNSVTSTTMNYAFTRGNGTGGVLVIAKAGSVPSDPVSGTSYTANSVYGSGTAVGGGFCVYKGTAAGTGNPTGNIAITGLSCLTTYYFAVYEYNTVGTCFNLTELTGNAATVPPGDQTTYGAGTWIGYVYTWSGSPDFTPGNYKGYITQATTFDRNPADVPAGGNICGGAYTDNFSIRFKMTYNFPAGNYVFTIGGDDGVRLSIDGGSTWIIDGWSDHGYTTYSNNPCVILNGSKNLVFEYYENAGGARASFSYTTVGGSCYCAANGASCDEYISNVTVGSINNSTACTTTPQGYGDYTAQTTSMNIGTGYPITVTNGNAYSTDQCGIWVDWNQDADFADANETMTITGTPGYGPYTATITPPAGATTGNTRMRVRIHYSDESTSSCGSSVWGEVEDYTINVLGCVAPTTSASSITFSVVLCTQMNVNWTNGNGGRRIVVAKANAAVAGNPVDGNDYAENSSFGAGGTIAAGEYVVYDGTGSSFTLTNLASGTTYYFKAFEYNCTGASIKYRTTSPPSASQATNAVPGTPSVISGSQNVCINQTGVSYSVTIANATSYTWAYSGSGFTNTSGSVNPISADFSTTATSGNLTVYGTSACGNGPTSAALAITVSTTPPTSVDAGEDQYICGNPATMAATGTGTWAILNGTGTITTPSSATTTVTVTNAGSSVTFRWGQTNGCGTAYDEVVINRQ